MSFLAEHTTTEARSCDGCERPIPPRQRYIRVAYAPWDTGSNRWDVYRFHDGTCHLRTMLEWSGLNPA